MTVGDVKETMIVEMVVHIGDKDGECDSAPKLFDVRLGIGAVLADGIDNFSVGVLGSATSLFPEQSRSRNIHQPALFDPVESANQSDGHSIAS